MNIFCSTATEISTTVTSNITTDTNNNNFIINNNNNNNNVSVYSVALSASLSFLCGASLGCNGGDGFQVWKLASIILNNCNRHPTRGVFQFGGWATW